jgi:hypothetical protein
MPQVGFEATIPVFERAMTVSLPNIIRIISPRRMRCSGNVARMGEKRNSCTVLVGEPDGKRLPRRPRYRL